jgi:hypothetical protein
MATIINQHGETILRPTDDSGALGWASPWVLGEDGRTWSRTECGDRGGDLVRMVKTWDATSGHTEESEREVVVARDCPLSWCEEFSGLGLHTWESDGEGGAVRAHSCRLGAVSVSASEWVAADGSHVFREVMAEVSCVVCDSPEDVAELAADLAADLGRAGRVLASFEEFVAKREAGALS